jgi:subtilase family serine protease
VGTVEETTDIEVVAAFAPAASILAYEAPVSGGLESYVDNFGAIVQQDRAQVVSGSWGCCEPVIPQSMLRVEAQLFQEMALQGQSMMAAAGTPAPRTACACWASCRPGSPTACRWVIRPASRS